MCGIVGVCRSKHAVAPEQLDAMLETIRHRGPDASGTYISSSGHVGLGHNRLAILDLSEAGGQPMSTVDGRHHIVFNGEIYNFRELRESIEGQGKAFRSQSDTEVLQQLFVDKGDRCLELLNGMFAFAVYDEAAGSLFLARDRVGIKPLYYVHKGGEFAFASEIKPLLQLPFVSREIDALALDAYFTLGYIAEDLCIFKDVRKLPPATWLRIDLATGEMAMERYWSPLNGQSADFALSEEDALGQLDEHLREAVRLRLVSDVPIGAFLSGGVDSSLVATNMASLSDTPIRTFNISFASSAHDESAYARIVAESIGSRHTERCVKIDDAAAVRALAFNYDEPFSDSSLIPTYYVSKVAREQVTVVLSGDGGDELFGGYNWYSWMQQVGDLDRWLGPMAKPVGRLSRGLPSWIPRRHALSSLGLDRGHRFLSRVGMMSEADRAQLLNGDLYNELGDTRYSEQYCSRLNGLPGDLIDSLTLTDFHHYLPEDILTKVDRASMAVSLEARVPWLDHNVVEFAYGLPTEMKIRRGIKKVLPKQLAAKQLPAGLDVERKQGFSVPLQAWMRMELGDLLEDALADPPPFLNVDRARTLLARHRACCRQQLGWPLFAVLMYALWWKEIVS